MKKGGKKKEAEKAIDEVEELLKVTEDELLLNLTLNSHTKSKFPESSNSNPIIDSDLDRRFRALRSKPNPDVDNLFARFAALKAPNPTTQEDTKVVKHIDTVDVESQEEEEDEVQKIINWAIDAARLDPSPSSDIDDQEDTYSDSDSDSALPKNK